MQKIKFEDIISVYSGRPGCCCGCKGKHTYRSELREEGGRERGYPVDDDEVSDRTVKRFVNKMNGDPRTVDEGDLFSLDTGTRWYIAYKHRRA